MTLDELDGSNGFVVHHEVEYALLGGDTAAAGDVNGDGLDDILVGSTGAGDEGAGAGYIVFGTRAPMPEVLSVLSLDGENGFAAAPASSDSRSAGSSVAAGGDINQDGLDGEELSKLVVWRSELGGDVFDSIDEFFTA